MRPIRLIALPLLMAMPIMAGAVTRTDANADARLTASVASSNPAVAAGSLDATLDVLAVFSPGSVSDAIGAWRRTVNPSPAGRRKTTLFVGLSTSIAPQVRARVATLGGTIVQVAHPGDAINSALSRDGSPMRVPSSDFAVLDDLTFTASWGRPIPLERGTQRLFHGRRAAVRATFLHGREYAVADHAAAWQRLVIPLSDGTAEFVWTDRADGTGVPPLLGRPVRMADYEIYDVVFPRLHRHEVASLKAALTSFGLASLFAGSAGRGGVKLADLVQSTDLTFDERGIQLHADTVGFTALGVLHHPLRQIVVDRSFWLRIADAKNRSVYVARVDDL